MVFENEGLLFGRELAPEDGLRGRVGDGGKLRVKVGGLGGIARGSDAGWQRGAGGCDNAGDLGLDAGVEISLRRLEFGDPRLQRGGIGGRRIALGAERFEIGGQHGHLPLQALDVGGRFGLQVGLGFVIPLEVGDLGAGFG